MNKNKRSLAPKLLGALFLVALPIVSQADCAEIKERYWRCARSSMTGEACDSSDNVSIPPECLTAGSKSQENNSSPTSTSTPSFLDLQKKSTPSVSVHPTTDIAPKKPVKIINIKPSGKTYIETEEDVNQFTTKVRDDLLNAIKDGKKVRLQFE
jgi:hypothetical protein